MDKYIHNDPRIQAEHVKALLLADKEILSNFTYHERLARLFLADIVDIPTMAYVIDDIENGRRI